MRRAPTSIVAAVAVIGVIAIAWLAIATPSRTSDPDLGRTVVLHATTTAPAPAPSSVPSTSSSAPPVPQAPPTTAPASDPPGTYPTQPPPPPPTRVGPGASVITPTTICDAGDQDDDLDDTDIDDTDDPCG